MALEPSGELLWMREQMTSVLDAYEAFRIELDHIRAIFLEHTE